MRGEEGSEKWGRKNEQRRVGRVADVADGRSETAVPLRSERESEAKHTLR